MKKTSEKTVRGMMFTFAVIREYPTATIIETRATRMKAYGREAGPISTRKSELRTGLIISSEAIIKNI